MVGQFNVDLLKRFLAPGVDERPEADLPDLRAEFDQSQFWVQNYFLNSVFTGAYFGQAKLYAESFLARAQITLAGYETARAKLADYVEHWHIGAPGIGRYLAAVGEWEAVVLNLQIAHDLLLKFMGNGGSLTGREDRARLIANRIKHVSEDIQNGALVDVGIPMWLTREGFVTRVATITYAEMGGIVRAIGEIADCLYSPSESRARMEAWEARLSGMDGDTTDAAEN